MIPNIDIERLHPHPHNPRKDLGDLTELTEGIKAHGILQNLTVVPDPVGYCKNCNLYNGAAGRCSEGHDKHERPPCSYWEGEETYTVLIGHRRLAAAKLAGLTELPCVVVELEEKDQISVMLSENMQRTDLTVLEQAEGIQMMLDLGDSVKGISDKTGLSETTIRKRQKLMELDRGKLEAAVAKNVRMEDFVKLEAIKDIKLRNKVLGEIGTSNFDWSVKNAVQQEERDKRKESLLKKIDEFAKLTKSTNGLEQEKHFHNFDAGDFKKPKDADTIEYFYTTDSWGLTLYKKASKKENRAKTAEEKEFEARGKKIEAITKLAYELRYEFIKDLLKSNHSYKKHVGTIMKFTAEVMMHWWGSLDAAKVLQLLDMEASDELGAKEAMIMESFSTTPERTMLAFSYCKATDSARENYCHSYNYGTKGHMHTENDKLDAIYELLGKFGYEMSDEEKAMQNGTHELFDKPEPEEMEDEDDYEDDDEDDYEDDDEDTGIVEDYEPGDNDELEGEGPAAGGHDYYLDPESGEAVYIELEHDDGADEGAAQASGFSPEIVDKVLEDMDLKE